MRNKAKVQYRVNVKKLFVYKKIQICWMNKEKNVVRDLLKDIPKNFCHEWIKK